MKKSRKVVSLVLVFVMFVSLLTGIKLYFSDDISEVHAGTVSKEYTVLEFVPNISMAQFGYLVGQGQEPVDMNAAWGTYSSAFSAYGSKDSGTYVSNELFRKKYLPAKEGDNDIEWTITVKTRTPKTLTQADLDTADLIVISQTVDKKLPKGSDWNTYRNTAKAEFASEFVADGAPTSFMSNDVLTFDTALAILKRVAGASGDPYKHANAFVDYSLYDKASKNQSCTIKPYVASVTIHGEQGNSSKLTVSNGSLENAYKLYLMLTSMNPSTFYGLYFNTETDSYGIDEEGYIHCMKTSGTTEWIDRDERESVWSPELIAPYFLLNASWDNSFSALGWNTVTSVNKGSAVVAKDGNVLQNGVIIYNVKDNESIASSSTFDGVASAVGTVDISKRYSIYTGGYRILGVELNEQTSINNTIAANIVKKYFTNKKGLLGGARVDYMSLLQFAGTNKTLIDDYDAIYLSSNVDSGLGKAFYGAYAVSNAAVYTKGISRPSKPDWTGWPADTGWNDSGKYAARDITTATKNELISFIAEKPVIFSSDLIAANAVSRTQWEGNTTYKVATDTNYYSFVNSYKGNANALVDNGNDGSKIDYASLISKVEANSFELIVGSQPATYYDYGNFNFNAQNGTPIYEYSNNMTEKAKNEYKDKVYINTSKNDYSRLLKFSFFIDDASDSESYVAKLYIDMNGDGRFVAASNGTLASFKLADDGNEYYDGNGELFAKKTGIVKGNNADVVFDVLPDNFVGPVTWKLEIVRSGSTTASVVGYSACQAPANNPAKINILQIVSVDCFKAWGGNEGANLEAMEGSMLPLPMKDEIDKLSTDAKNALAANMAAGNVDGVAKAFSGIITRDWRQNPGGTINKNAKITWSNEKRDMVPLYNAGVYYYMLSKQLDYDVNVYRVSTDEFEKKVASGDIKVDNETGYISYPNPYSKSDGSRVNCNLLVIGFGEYTSDITDTAALNVLKKYIQKGNAVFAGRGVVRPVLKINGKKHNLTELFLPYIGMSSNYDASVDAAVPEKIAVEYVYGGDDLTMGVQGIAEAIRSSYTALNRYPLYIPSLVKSSSVISMPYALSLEKCDDITVLYSFVSAQVGGSAKDDTFNDIVNNYLIYKKQNFTVCAMGFTEGNAKIADQKTSCLKLPEAGMIVNAILGSKMVIPDPEEIDDTVKFIVTNDEVDKDKEHWTDSSSIPAEKRDIDRYNLYEYFDAAGPVKGNDAPISTSDDGIVVKNGKLCQPVSFVLQQNEAADTDIQIEFRTTNNVLLNDLYMENASGTKVTDFTKLEANVEYTVYIPLENSYYKTKGAGDNYGIISNDAATEKNNSMEIKVFTYTDTENPHAEEATGRSAIRVTVRGIFLID